MSTRLVAGSVIIDDDRFGTPGPPGWFIGVVVLFVLIAFGTAASTGVVVRRGRPHAWPRPG